MVDAKLLAAFSDLAFVLRRNEIFPVAPTLWAPETPLAHIAPGDEDRPCRFATEQLNTVGGRCTAKDWNPASAIKHHTRACRGIRLDRNFLQIAAADYDGQIPPWMIMQRTVIVAATELMEIDVEPAIARDDPPPSQIRIRSIADDEVRRALNQCICPIRERRSLTLSASMRLSC